ncbi:Deoxyuridine 5'-triphosphate nucleotidohydrolase [compost metagenome]
MTAKKRIISLIGRPGCGKTTLGTDAAALLGMTYISSGDIAREVTKDNRLNRGELGPEESVRVEVAKAIREVQTDVILDGMPRHVDQLYWFVEEFKDFEIRFVHVDVPHNICLERLAARQRDEGDGWQSVHRRLESYNHQTKPILDIIWASEFRPAPYAKQEHVNVDFCRFLLSSRSVEKKVKIKLLEDHPLFGHSADEIEELISGYSQGLIKDPNKAVLFRKHAGDAGLDLFVTHPVIIPARGKANIQTSIAIEIPPFYWYNVDKRSSTYYTRDMLVIEAVIDNGYRGELFCTVHNPTDQDKLIDVGESVAQIIFHELVGYDFGYELVDDLSDSDRGEGGFGSTTKHKDAIRSLYADKKGERIA